MSLENVLNKHMEYIQTVDIQFHHPINEQYIQPFHPSMLFSFEHKYSDTYNIISQQEYIEKYEIYDNQHIDIDLNSWRWNKYVDYKNWYNKYRETYHIEWAHHKWLNVSKYFLNTSSPFILYFLANNLECSFGIPK
jgi:hypothetical protein